MEMTETVQVKRELTQVESLDLAQTMARAEATMGEKADDLKSVTAQIKADIAVQEAVLHACAEKLRSGYKMVSIECVVKYDKGTATYADKDSGEIIETRHMTQEEQLRLSEHRVDAEQVIRQASKEE